MGKNSYIAMTVLRLQKNHEEHVVHKMSPTVNVMSDGAIIQHPEMLYFCQCVCDPQWFDWIWFG